jgi:hypothetical protein
MNSAFRSAASGSAALGKAPRKRPLGHCRLTGRMPCPGPGPSPQGQAGARHARGTPRKGPAWCLPVVHAVAAGGPWSLAAGPGPAAHQAKPADPPPTALAPPKGTATGTARHRRRRNGLVVSRTDDPRPSSQEGTTKPSPPAFRRAAFRRV